MTNKNNIVEFLKEDKAKNWILSKFNNEKEINRFKSNLVSIANDNKLLAIAEPATIMTAVYQETLFNLPMEKNFGYAYVILYQKWAKQDNQWVIESTKAQFQMGYKGYIQLAQRTGQYLDISVSDVKENELIKYDRLKGTEFNWNQNEEEREQLNTIGYVAYFKLINGFEKTLYMTKDQMESHFMKYSKTYAKNKKFELATFDEMALKTVLTQLLRKWGIMSVELQEAYKSDQAVIQPNGALQYIDNDNSTPIITHEQNNETVVEEYKEEVMTISNDNFIVDDLTDWESEA